MSGGTATEPLRCEGLPLIAMPALFPRPAKLGFGRASNAHAQAFTQFWVIRWERLQHANDTCAGGSASGQLLGLLTGPCPEICALCLPCDQKYARADVWFTTTREEANLEAAAKNNSSRWLHVCHVAPHGPSSESFYLPSIGLLINGVPAASPTGRHFPGRVLRPNTGLTAIANRR